MGADIKKLVIDRSRWLRGEGADSSRLLRCSDRKMCCLGFFGKACGYSDAELAGVTTPRLVDDTGLWPEWLFSDQRQHSYDTTELMRTNDLDPTEAEIAAIFARHGVEVEFIDGDLPAPSTSEKPISQPQTGGEKP